MLTEIYVKCPHCECMIELIQINCGIFRHGVYKSTMQQMNAHASETECNDAIMKDEIYGCGKPFRVELINDEYIAITCPYI